MTEDRVMKVHKHFHHSVLGHSFVAGKRMNEDRVMKVHKHFRTYLLLCLTTRTVLLPGGGTQAIHATSFAAEFRIAHTINFAHPAFAELGDNRVLSDCFARVYGR